MHKVRDTESWAAMTAAKIVTWMEPALVGMTRGILEEMAKDTTLFTAEDGEVLFPANCVGAVLKEVSRNIMERYQRNYMGSDGIRAYHAAAIEMGCQEEVLKKHVVRNISVVLWRIAHRHFEDSAGDADLEYGEVWRDDGAMPFRISVATVVASMVANAPFPMTRQ